MLGIRTARHNVRDCFAPLAMTGVVIAYMDPSVESIAVSISGKDREHPYIRLHRKEREP